MGNSRSSCLRPKETLNNPDEIMIMGNINDIVPLFPSDSTVIWYDPNVNSPENMSHTYDMKTIFDGLQTFTHWEEASSYLKETKDPYCHVITSEINGESLIKEISGLPNVSAIYVFCSDINDTRIWTEQYHKVICVESDKDELMEGIRQNMISWQKKRFSLRDGLPNYAPAVDSMDKNEANPIQLYLKGLMNFKNRPQSKKDFLTLANAVYTKRTADADDIDDFKNKYDEYSMENVFNWYYGGSFVYKMVNNCLKIGSSDSIQYCRYFLKDLENAIKDKYQQESINYSGILYRGAYISDKEWTKLQQNIGKDIEMFGFLSATKQKQLVLDFIENNHNDIETIALITIILPNAPYRGEQGFAEIREYSRFPEEDEVLFNLRSRFTVLETNTEEINGLKTRHLVLLYGTQAIKAYASIENPNIRIEVNNIQLVNCNQCQIQLQIDEENMLKIDLTDTSNMEYLCKSCFRKPQTQDNRPTFLCISPHAHDLSGSAKDELSLQVEGFVMKHKESLKIPFYGYKCTECGDTKFGYCCYKCLSCEGGKRMYCDKCFFSQSGNDCVKQGHMVVLESEPYSFWSEKMSEKELDLLEQQAKPLSNNQHLFQQAEVFYQTKNYSKVIEYYQKFLKQNQNVKSEHVAICFTNLGEAYKGLGQYKRAIEYYLQALKIRRSIFTEKHPDTASTYTGLGLLYDNIGDYHRAMDYHFQAVRIRKALFGDRHPDVGASYNNLGNAYSSLGEYYKAIDCFSQGLEIQKQVLGEKHPDIATCLNNVGSAYSSLGEYHKAIGFHLQALDIQKEAFDDNHPDTATSYNNIGGAYHSLGNDQKAIKFYSQALKIWKSIHGDNHQDTAISYNNLGGAHDSLREYQTAIGYYTQALDIRKFIFGDKHPDTATSYNNLGSAYHGLGECQKAIKFYLQALEIRKGLFGEYHPDSAGSNNNLGGAYYTLKEYEKAVDYYMQAVKIQRVVYGEKHPDIAVSYSNLGCAYALMGKYQKASEFHLKAFEMRRVIFGESHAYTLEAQSNFQAAKQMLENNGTKV